ncbi:MAG: hypothetical protein GF401_19150 [Chitinivibrionales bacterium]|nr:hypothetical protein [Chitinivibrionales bacterium]
MKQSYRVCIIVPRGYTHASAFLEVAFLLKNSLVSCGKSCDIKINELSTDNINIILGGHLLRADAVIGKYTYIPYQLEQISANERLLSDNVKTLLRHAHDIWDYSMENIVFLKSQGMRAKHLPLGYHPALEQVPSCNTRDIDILFYGSVGERRKKILDSLTAKDTVSVKTLFGVYGKQRDEFVGRSKIILNVHHYNAKIFEAVRISYLLNNRCFVVSEDTPVNPYPQIEIPMVSYENLVDACLYYLSDEQEREQIADACYRQFKKNYSMDELLRNVIE